MRVSQEERPILLVVCEEPQRMERIRGALRRAGILSAPGRSPDAAVSLLTQVIVDGCVLCEPFAAADADRIIEAFARAAPSLLRLCVLGGGSSCPAGWVACDEEGLPDRVWEMLRGGPPVDSSETG